MNLAGSTLLQHRVKQHFQCTCAIIPLTIAAISTTIHRQILEKVFIFMTSKSPKKGPHSVKTKHKRDTHDQFSPKEFEAKLNSFFAEVHEDINKARSKMSDADVERADEEAKSILKAASGAAKSSPRAG